MKLKISRNSLWLCYSLLNPSLLNTLIPPGLEIAKVSPIEGVRPREMLLFNAYEVDAAPWMKGARVDIQTFVRDKESGTAHLVVLDVLSDTRNWDPVNGITRPNSGVNVKHTPGIDVQFAGVDIFSVKGNPGKKRKPNYTFIVEANRKCYFSNFKRGYEMYFNEDEIMHPVTELKDLKIKNSCWNDFRGCMITAFKHNIPMEFDVQVNPFLCWQ